MADQSEDTVRRVPDHIDVIQKRVAGITANQNRKYTAKQLWSECQKYVKWNKENPLYEYKVTQYMGEPVTMVVPKMRAMTLKALHLHLGIGSSTWDRWKKAKDLGPVCEMVDDIIYTQKFEGAAAELLNSNIITRDLGLKEKSEHEHTVDITEIRRTIVDPKS